VIRQRFGSGLLCLGKRCAYELRHDVGRQHYRYNDGHGNIKLQVKPRIALPQHLSQLHSVRSLQPPLRPFY